MEHFKRLQVKTSYMVLVDTNFSLKFSDIIVTSETKNVRVTIDYKTVVGFEMCAFAKTYLTPDQGARLSWRANENVTVTILVLDYNQLQ